MIGIIHEISGAAIIDDQKDLCLNPQGWVLTAFWHARAKTFTRCCIACCVDPMDFDRITRFDLAIATIIGRKLGLR